MGRTACTLVGYQADVSGIYERDPDTIGITHRFDLLSLAPLVHGWALLEEAGAYVRVSCDRFEAVEFSLMGLAGADGETIEVTALQPLSGAAEEWTVLFIGMLGECGVPISKERMEHLMGWLHLELKGAQPTVAGVFGALGLEAQPPKPGGSHANALAHHPPRRLPLRPRCDLPPGGGSISRGTKQR